jgi:hypothetical protein
MAIGIMNWLMETTRVDIWRPKIRTIAGAQQAPPASRAGKLETNPTVLLKLQALGWRNASIVTLRFNPTSREIIRPIRTLIGESRIVRTGVVNLKIGSNVKYPLRLNIFIQSTDPVPHDPLLKVISPRENR